MAWGYQIKDSKIAKEPIAITTDNETKIFFIILKLSSIVSRKLFIRFNCVPSASISSSENDIEAS